LFPKLHSKNTPSRRLQDRQSKENNFKSIIYTTQKQVSPDPQAHLHKTSDPASS
jgi:hypothetical protein